MRPSFVAARAAPSPTGRENRQAGPSLSAMLRGRTGYGYNPMDLHRTDASPQASPLLTLDLSLKVRPQSRSQSLLMEGRKATDLAAAFRKLYGHAEDDQTTFGQVLEMDGQIDALLATPGWAVITQLIEVVEQQEMTGLIGGLKPLEQAEYAQKLAHVRGLRAALDAPATIKAVVAQFRKEAETRARALDAMTGSG
jgi:hypothetical protein